MRKRTLASTAMVCLLGTSLLGVSAPTCACREPWMDFLLVLGVNGSHTYANLDGPTITAEANRHLLGQSLSQFEFPASTQPTSCDTRNARRFDCEFWFLKGPVRDRGFRVTLDADAQGKVTAAQVTNLHRVFGLRLPL